MADYRFFCDKPDGSVVTTKDAHYDRGVRNLPKIWDVDSKAWVRATRVVIRKSNPSMHECDARCMNATGRTMQCECSCGGKNHGKGSSLVCLAA